MAPPGGRASAKSLSHGNPPPQKREPTDRLFLCMANMKASKFSGAHSALSMIAASHWLIHDRHQRDGAPAPYFCVGIGILVSAEMIALAHFASWSSR